VPIPTLSGLAKIMMVIMKIVTVGWHFRKQQNGLVAFGDDMERALLALVLLSGVSKRTADLNQNLIQQA